VVGVTLDSAAAMGVVEAVGLKLAFGGVVALQGVSISAAANTTVGIIGPNGAGKTSLLNCLNGFYRPQSGTVKVNGHVVTGIAPHRIARLGVARTFQAMELVPEATVLENILLGCHIHGRTGVISGFLYWGRTLKEEIRLREIAEGVIEFLEIERLRYRLVGDLSAGQQKLIGLARALAAQPKILLLDEPSAGMNREERLDVARFILRIKYERPTTQVLIEHDLRFVRDLCDYVYVLNFGTLIAEGRPEEVFRDQAVIDAYTGSGTTVTAG
jgi:branched-chain amino acid transport system ATP-binding protein